MNRTLDFNNAYYFGWAMYVNQMCINTTLGGPCTSTKCALMYFKLLYTGFETYFALAPKVLGSKHISNPDCVPF